MSPARTGYPLEITDSNMAQAHFIAPGKAKMGTMHIILAVTDHGTPALTSYKLILITVEK